MKITALRARDIRFPTSREKDGSDALNLGDYSAVYVVLETDGPHAGYGLTFTNGHGTEIGVAVARALSRLVVGHELESITADFRGFYRRLTQDPQLRWIGPEKGIVHMTTGAVLNAIWDLWARRERKPVWKLLADLTPQQRWTTFTSAGSATPSRPTRRWRCWRSTAPPAPRARRR